MATFLRKPAAVQVWRYGGPALAPELADDALWITASGLQAMQVPIGPSKHWGGNCGEEDCQERWTITVETAHGTANVRVGDWIAKGPIDWWPIDDEHFQIGRAHV